MSKSIYLLNPASDFPSYYGAEVMAMRGLAPAMSMADLTMATVAALAPASFAVQICEGHVTPVDWETDADFVGITGNVAQWRQMKLASQEFRRRGRIVLIGGPFASLSPESVRPYCDILVRGELEEVAAELFSDLERGAWKDEYVGTRPDLCLSPVPRWGLYPLTRSISGTVQTSRGCPFECEFCDVIQYLGRKQRHKAPARVLAEMDMLYGYGLRQVLLADDNFTVHRQRAKELLVALRAWNRKQERGWVNFFTQASIDAAEDHELLRLCAEAGVASLFVGIETPNADSHREMKKRQNLRGDLRAKVEAIVAHGIEVNGGMIVGFDSDGLDIFERQFDFAMSLPVPIFSLGTLNAPPATPLHARL